ncbi:MAG: RNA methyltransferase [Lentimicrobiaceae bacterium]|nr:RNA methyltransferase [Lentimicrobiaceae bacterium]
MAGKNQLKWVKKLHQQKYRQQHGLFLAEGVKVVDELLASRLEVISVFATDEWVKSHPPATMEIIPVSSKELEIISTLKQPNQVLAVGRIPQIPPPEHYNKGWSLMLDMISDPGNMGTIIRIADWFGFERLLVARHSVDIWNPKVVQAAMGSLFRVPVHVVDPVLFLESVNNQLPVYATLLNGKPVNEVQFAQKGIVVIGNESRGISPQLMPYITHRITIPAARQMDEPGAESLNASMATAIVCYEINRQAANSNRPKT